MIKIIGDLGSSHCNNFQYIIDAVDLCKELDIWCVKLQLFKGEEYTKYGNIELDRNMWSTIVAHARHKDIEITASVFDTEAIDLLEETKCKYIKIAYDKVFDLPLVKYIREKDFIIIGSGDNNHFPDYCQIKLFRPKGYPPKIRMYDIKDFCIYDGLSSHYLGWELDKAFCSDFLKDNIFLEKHITLNQIIKVPDDTIALTPKLLRKWVKEIRSIKP